jgi:hypothetical protein
MAFADKTIEAAADIRGVIARWTALEAFKKAVEAST